MADNQSFSGTCPTCGQRYYADEIERLRHENKLLKEIAFALTGGEPVTVTLKTAQ